MWEEVQRAQESQELPTGLRQLWRWLTTETLCGVNTNSKKVALLWEFYKLVGNNGREGVLVFYFTENHTAVRLGLQFTGVFS